VNYIQASGEKALAMPPGLPKLAPAEGRVKKAVDTSGRTDILVNNVGILPITPRSLLTVDEWDRC
jgi:NAD(P)-dependent dehydrogenase (short-subunit alcohol dehydrogenase family)